MAVLKANPLRESREPAIRTVSIHLVLTPPLIWLGNEGSLEILTPFTKLLQQACHDMIVPQIMTTTFVHACLDRT